MSDRSHLDPLCLYCVRFVAGAALPDGERLAELPPIYCCAAGHWRICGNSAFTWVVKQLRQRPGQRCADYVCGRPPVLP
jgi:hypothetical protein